MIRFPDAEGEQNEIACDVVAGTDGSGSYCRFLIPEDQRTHYFREYPFAWFGILAESPMSAPELIYAHSERGFALVSQRTESIQRLYMQCPIDEDIEAWSNQQIWDELQARVEGDGFELKRGPIFERALLRFRSFVAEPMRWGRLVLAGDAADTVPPTGAKGSTWPSTTFACSTRCSPRRWRPTTSTSWIGTGREHWTGYGDRKTSPTG